MIKSTVTDISPRYFSIAGITLAIRADLAFGARTFSPKLEQFAIPTPGSDQVNVTYHFALPKQPESSYGELVYHQKPWRIYRDAAGWTYVGFTEGVGRNIFLVATTDPAYRDIHVYHPGPQSFRDGNRHSLIFDPTDQVMLTPMLAERQACIVHSAGLVYHGAGLLFVGHSEAGKSTMVTLLRDEAEILCDDRVVLRCWPDGIKIHGTWSHGDVPDVSPAGAPLRAILFLEKAPVNALVPMTPREVAGRLPEHLIKTVVGRGWWEKMLDLVAATARQVPAYRVQFDKTGQIKDLLRPLVDGS